MFKHTHVRVVAACLGLFTFTAAQATLSPIANTPANDALDAATGLAWIKTATLQEGLAQGYRLATSSEAKALDYLASTTTDGVFALGVDKTNSVRANDYLSFANSVSIGHVAGPAGQVQLAGYAFSTSTSITVPGSYYDPALGTTVYPPSYTTTSRDNHLLVGDLALFANVRDVGVARSQYLKSDGTYGDDGCLAGGCYPGNTLWDGVLGSSNSDAAVGYFMVKSTVPEPATALTWPLGLLVLGTLARRRRASWSPVKP